jgi:alpha-D-glucose phosphate-specific phosphoglucomutase
MKNSPIHFGTDGWRATIAQEYTFDNLKIVAAALAAYLRKNQNDKIENGVAIGYDTRFLSAEFAHTAGEVLSNAGIPTKVSDRDSTTPAIAWAVRGGGLASGVMITASHNPPKYNGFKFIDPDGSPADKTATSQVEALLGKKLKPTEKLNSPATLATFDPRPSYFRQLKTVVDFDLLKKNKGKAVCDFVNGTGRGYLDHLLRECNWKVKTIRENPDPMFGGMSPDPANPECQKNLEEAVKAAGADAGLANDPDADRFGFVDGAGKSLSANQCLVLMYVHLLEHRGMRGPVARSVATTGMLDSIARKFGQEVIETPVGFKWIGAAIEDQGAILGGEESNGMSMAGHTPGKDGILADLLLAEIWAVHRQPLSEVFKKLMRKYGSFYSARIDLRLTDEEKNALMEKMESKSPGSIAGSKVTGKVLLDGVKFNLADNSWLLMRPSGTEPLVRVYLEAPSQKRLKELQAAAQELR